MLKKVGPQPIEIGMSSAELGRKHTLSCCAADRELEQVLKSDCVSDGARKVVCARFFSLKDLRQAYADCADRERQEYLCAPFLHGGTDF